MTTQVIVSNPVDSMHTIEVETHLGEVLSDKTTLPPGGSVIIWLHSQQYVKVVERSNR